MMDRPLLTRLDKAVEQYATQPLVFAISRWLRKYAARLAGRNGVKELGSRILKPLRSKGKVLMRSGCLLLLAGTLAMSGSAQETRPAIQVAPRAQESTPTAGATVEAKPQAVSSDTYILGTGDILQLSVWKEPGLSNPSVPVRPDGQVSLPLLGDVPAAGITPMALANDITTRLKKYMNDPQVTVTVSGVRPKEIFLIGEILKTGPVLLTPGMNPLQAIAAGGGLTAFAKKKLYILRKTGTTEQKIPFDYKKAIKTGDQQGVSLMAGDTIVVP